MPRPIDRVYVEIGAGRRSAAVCSLTGSSSRLAVLGQTVVGLGLRAGGSRLMHSVGALPVWPYRDSEVVSRALCQVVRGFSLLGAVAPRQADRQRLAVFGTARGSTVLVKMSPDPVGIHREAEVLSRLSQNPLPSVATARLLEHGTVRMGDNDVHVVAMEHVHGRQRPAWSARPLSLFGRELAGRLNDLDRPEGIPHDWVPNHLDLTPWNLRRTPRGLCLFDWESCGFAPFDTDRSYFEACVAAMRRGPAPTMSEATRQFILHTVTDRLGRGALLDQRLHALLVKPDGPSTEPRG